jgi:nucleotide-binding universal stress UspA family protein
MSKDQKQDRRIIVGTDGSPHAMKAVTWAATQARLTGSRLELVASWEEPAPYGMPLALAGVDLEANARELIDKAAADIDLPADRLQTRVVYGPAARMLVEMSEDADLLVVGSRGHGGLAGALLGSVSTYCVRHAKCPVVVVR